MALFQLLCEMISSDFATTDMYSTDSLATYTLSLSRGYNNAIRSS
jgi:hypothetical protein